MFTSKGIVGRFAFVSADTPRFVYSPQLCFWRSVDSNRIDPRFLFCWMSGREFLVQFKGVAGQTDMADYVSLTDQRRMHITLPPIVEQRAIGRVAGALDDKIELNRRMSETLEAFAMSVFSAFLTRRDLPRANTADLVHDRILEIGDGYRAKNSELGTPGLPFIRAGNLNNGFDTRGADRLLDSSVQRANGKVSRPGDVAFTSKGTIGRFARVPRDSEAFVYSPQVCYWRSLDHERLHPAVLYCWMKSDDLKSQLAAVANQTDMAPYVSLQDQRRMTMPLFPATQQAVARQIELLLDRQASALGESRTLAAIRDTLLPKLISGQLRLRDAERIVGHAR